MGLVQFVADDSLAAATAGGSPLYNRRFPQSICSININIPAGFPISPGNRRGCAKTKRQARRLLLLLVHRLRRSSRFPTDNGLSTTEITDLTKTRCPRNPSLPSYLRGLRALRGSKTSLFLSTTEITENTEKTRQWPRPEFAQDNRISTGSNANRVTAE